jgi:DNA modification methylase
MLQRFQKYKFPSFGLETRLQPAAAKHNFLLFERNAKSVLQELPDHCVDTCLTSPPYWAARDYGVENQIGLEHEVTDYVAHLVEVFGEVHRILKPGGSVWLNIGDKYLSGVGTVNGRPPKRGWRETNSSVWFRFELPWRFKMRVGGCGTRSFGTNQMECRLVQRIDLLITGSHFFC